MSHSLLFIPDISGFTQFVQKTESEHSEHVIAEILQILVDSNQIGMTLAEIEGDALFFYKKEIVPELADILDQIKTMFTAFYSHMELLRANRICSCAACALAPELNLKIVVHCGKIQFLTLQGSNKPFGQSVIEAHRLLKNSISSSTYALISQSVLTETEFEHTSNWYHFQAGQDTYDGKSISYIFSEVNQQNLSLTPFKKLETIEFVRDPDVELEQTFQVSAQDMFEIITNYRYRSEWIKGVDSFVYNENEVTRLGTEHLCVINGKNIEFTAVLKNAPDNVLVYGEETRSIPIADRLYQFFLITPINEKNSKITFQAYLESDSILKKVLLKTVVKHSLRKNIRKSVKLLHKFISTEPFKE